MKFGKQVKNLRVPSGSKVDLKEWKTSLSAVYRDDDSYREHLEQFKSEIAALQEKLYAQAQYSVLVIFQGMDTSGKDGAISHVMSGVNPQGCFVHSFKTPSEDELKQDFLWRSHWRVPARGEIGIFNRSYYEEVLVVRVHPELLDAQKLPKEARETKHFWRSRLEDIRNHEAYLSRQGVKVVKFFLHISKEEQRERLVARIDEPNKQWKISIGDFREREFWSDYQKAYESCLSETSTKECPWFIVPADDKKNARLLISQILLDELKSLDLEFPALNPEQKKKIAKMKKTL